jgi:glycosyltransferase involved in cell wall biosynthesis
MTICFIANGICSYSLSGGDIYFIELIKRYFQDGFEIELITDRMGFSEISKITSGVPIKYYISDKTTGPINNSLGIIIHYLIRGIKSVNIIKNLLPKKNNRVFFITSDFYCDTLVHPFISDIQKIQMIHMLAPNPFYGYTQSFHFPHLNEIHYLISNFISFILIFIGNYHMKRIKIVAVTKEICKNISKSIFLKYFVYYLIPCGTNIVTIKKVLKKYDFVWIGRDHPQKGINDLKQILIKLKKYLPDFSILVLGNMTQSVLEFIKVNNLETNVIYKGFISGKEKFKQIAQAKIFLFTSHFESFPIVVLENLMVGNMVIGYKTKWNMSNFDEHMVYVNCFNTDDFSKTAVDVLSTNNYSYIVKNKLFVKSMTWETVYAKFRTEII